MRVSTVVQWIALPPHTSATRGQPSAHLPSVCILHVLPCVVMGFPPVSPRGPDTCRG